MREIINLIVIILVLIALVSSVVSNINLFIKLKGCERELPRTQKCVIIAVPEKVEPINN